MAENIPALYVSGQLSEQAQDEFEQHYFECDRCFEAVRTCQLVQAELSRDSRIAPRPPSRVPASAVLAMAASILLLVGAGWVVLRFRTPQQPIASAPLTQPPGSSLQQLAQFTPPDYVKPALRAAGNPEFEAAMRLYQQHDFAGAGVALKAVTMRDPGDEAAHFYLGISELMAGQTSEGIQALQRAAGLGGAIYVESAHFYLAKAYLHQNDAAHARDELDVILQLHGDLEAQARDLRTAIDAAGR